MNINRAIEALDLPLTLASEGEAAPIGEAALIGEAAPIGEADRHRGGEDLRSAVACRGPATADPRRWFYGASP